MAPFPARSWLHAAPQRAHPHRFLIEQAAVEAAGYSKLLGLRPNSLVFGERLRRHSGRIHRSLREWRTGAHQPLGASNLAVLFGHVAGDLGLHVAMYRTGS